MAEPRIVFWGSTPVYAVDDVDKAGELRVATFFSHGEARRFAASRPAATGRPVASTAAVQRANRALLARIANDDPPEPRTLGGVLRRIGDSRQSRAGRLL